MNKTSHQFYRDLALKDFQSIESKSSLIEFQSQYKYLFMAYHPSKQKELGLIIANPDKLPIEDVLTAYEYTLKELFDKPPSRGMVSNAFQHMYGYFRNELKLQEKENFSAMINQYRNKATSLLPLINQLQQWADAYNKQYIKQQKILSLPS